MKRKDFIKNSAAKISGIIALPFAITSGLTGCVDAKSQPSGENESCELSPNETAGPFPIKTPAELVRANIIADRKGVALLINLRVLNHRKSCEPQPGVFVDIWHCDSQRYYSEYGDMRMQHEDFREQHFLRGRQQTDKDGRVSFLSIYPGWYRGRAPHVHVEIVNDKQKSLGVTQIAFPDDVSDQVYKGKDYRGKADTPNERDGLFRNSLAGNMGTVSGNTKDGYTLNYDVVVNA